MRDPSERSESTPRPVGDRRRRPRFALPADHHDERTSEGIEAFIEGVQASRRHRRRHLRREGTLQPRRVVPLVTRADWDAALQREDARFARYGRPATVVVIDVRVAAHDTIDRHAPRVGSIVRQHARETDLVTRVSPGRFHVLLPETVDDDAVILVERIKDAAAHLDVGVDGPLTLVGVAISPPHGGTLADAVRRAAKQVDSADE